MYFFKNVAWLFLFCIFIQLLKILKIIVRIKAFGQCLCGLTDIMAVLILRICVLTYYGAIDLYLKNTYQEYADSSAYLNLVLRKENTESVTKSFCK